MRAVYNILGWRSIVLYCDDTFKYAMKRVGIMKVGVMEWSVGWRIIEEFLEYYPRLTCLIEYNAKFKRPYILSFAV